MGQLAKKYNVLDLFCGCGGMSWGLHQRNFNIIAGIDIWDTALKTFEYNHPAAKAIQADIALVNARELANMTDYPKDKIDIIIGGPPCQGFSKNLPATSRFLEDERNQLYKALLNIINFIRPKVAIIENVAEIYNAFGGKIRSDIIRELKNMGYYVNVKIINMSHMGIPQNRRRCFFFASEKCLPAFPEELPEQISAWGAISDLPIVNQGEGYDNMPYTSNYANPYQKYMRGQSKSVWNHVANIMSAVQTARIASIGPGQNLRDMPKELQTRRGGYSGAYGRLDYTSVAPTITRWVFHIGSGRYAHPREVRGLTMREAARIQSFSDEFHFIGTRNEQAGQIGNAVPPLFMERLAERIRAALAGKAVISQQCSLL